MVRSADTAQIYTKQIQRKVSLLEFNNICRKLEGEPAGAGLLSFFSDY